MNIDWDLFLKIIVPVSTLVLGKYLDRWLTKRPKLIVYLGHASSFTIRGETPGFIHTHAIVIRNTGRDAANNVRIGHNVLPDHYQLYPAVPHSVVRNADTVTELLFPKLVSGEQVSVSYIYFPPLLWSEIHAYTNPMKVLREY
jgi:hypothetical protein